MKPHGSTAAPAGAFTEIFLLTRCAAAAVDLCGFCTFGVEYRLRPFRPESTLALPLILIIGHEDLQAVLPT